MKSETLKKIDTVLSYAVIIMFMITALVAESIVLCLISFVITALLYIAVAKIEAILY